MSSAMEGKTAFITGADGFIGSHLVEYLIESNVKVKGLVHYNSWNSTGWLADLPSSILSEVELIRGDVRDADQMRNVVKNCHYVFHLSSLIAIPYSYEAPKSYVETNAVGGLNIMQACRVSDSLERVVHVSTSEVYGSAQTVPIAESHPLVAQSPYAASKIAADKIAESFFLSFGVPVVTARPFNTFGPRQTARAVIPTIASQLLSGASQLRLGSLHPTRDFNFVRNTVSGMVALAQCEGASGEVVNIGSGEEWSIAQTVQKLQQIVGRQVETIIDDDRIRPERSEVDRLLADNTKIRALTGWTPQIDFPEGLQLTVEWIDKNLSHFDIGSYAV